LARKTDASRVDQAEAEFFSAVQALVNVRRRPLAQPIGVICGTDAAYARDRVVAIASLSTHGKFSESAMYRGQVTFPYFPGLFYLREGPAVVAAVRRLSQPPQLLCLDCHGLAHPRFTGMATTIGAILRVPSIGIAKSRLVGAQVESGGEINQMVYDDRVVGYATRQGGPLRYWSPGYSVSLSELLIIIKRYGLICLGALAESHRLATLEIRQWRG